MFRSLCPSNDRSVNLEEPAQQLHCQLSDNQHIPSQTEDSINETIDSLRAFIRARDEYSSASIANPLVLN